MGNEAFFSSIFILISIMLAMAIVASPAFAATATPIPLYDQPGLVGSISGVVRDDRQNGVPGAEVTLYDCVNINGKYENRFKVDTANNPQFTSDGSKSVAGLFVFTSITRGTYNLTVTKDGYTASKIVSVYGGTVTQNIDLAGYAYGVKPSPTPIIATATPQPTSQPTNQPTNTSEIISIYEVLKILAMTAIGAQFVFCLVVLALFANKK